MTVSASIIVPTHNRHEAIGATIEHLLTSAERALAEVVVVDDGSMPPLVLPESDRLRVVRTGGVERSRARNHGACSARADLLVFVDDDMTVAAEFVEQHVRASQEFGDVIAVGRVVLPYEFSDAPFGRFRRAIEEASQTHARGLVAEPNFCTAQNMSIRRDTFFSLGGFDPAIVSGEDQDLALRFSGRGGRIVFLPEANALHRDSNMDIFSYSRRHEWGAMALAPFLRRYPGRPENLVRRRAGTSLPRAHFPLETAWLLSRMLLSREWSLKLVRSGVSVAQKIDAGDRVLFPLYRILLGLHLFRGFRAGLAQTLEAPPLPPFLAPSPSDL